MSPHNALNSLWRRGIALHILNPIRLRRALHQDGRNRLSGFWTPTQTKKQPSSVDSVEDGHDLLLRAGFLRQAHSGIFHLLPLGLRVQDKLERLIDKHMQSLGASKVSLSSISSQDLWRKSGRLEGRDSELFQLHDRKGAKYLLSPTHEEEITSIVKNAIHSYKDLPLRLYQVSRKYRDEARPRQGVLRGREFIMKDLYTFDVTEEHALKTYEDARAAYRAFFNDLNLPYLVANADSGNMGGNHSHEYHFISSRGEDTIIACGHCGMCINEELYLGNYKPDEYSQSTSLPPAGANNRDIDNSDAPFQVWYGRIPDSSLVRSDAKSEWNECTADQQKNPRGTAALLQVFLPKGLDLNTHAIKKLVPNVNVGEPVHPSSLGANGGESPWNEVLSFRDPRVPLEAIINSSVDPHESSFHIFIAPSDLKDIQIAPFLLTKAQRDDACPECSTRGSMYFQQAIEIGHTFHLGTRYSTPLEAAVQNEHNEFVEMQMGCHGIGVSRLLGAVASLLADDRGLNWPISIAPFGILLLGAGSISKDDVTTVYDHISSELAALMDAVIDDRERPIGWKLNDADLLGYPFIVVLGKAWKQRNAVEIQCRRLGIREEVPYEYLIQKLKEYSAKL